MSASSCLHICLTTLQTTVPRCTQANASLYGTPLMRPVWWEFHDAAALDFEEQ
eukprot:SAG31_NODE_13218_length_885_cov_0.912214_1_plen_52_part_10